MESDHWKLKPKQRDRLARPLAACANSLVERLLPESVADGASAHPEFVALLLAVLLIVAPRALKQFRLKRQKTGSAERKSPAKAGYEKSSAGDGPLPNIPATSGTLGA